MFDYNLQKGMFYIATQYPLILNKPRFYAEKTYYVFPQINFTS